MRFYVSLIGFLALCLTSMAAGESVLPADAEFKAGEKLPKVWEAHGNRPWERKKFTVMTEEGRTFTRCSKAVGDIRITRPVDPTWKVLRLSLDTRIQDLKKGKNNWDVPGVELDYLDEKGKSLLTWKKANWFSKNRDWKTLTREYPVPDGAEKVVCRIYCKAKGGTADFANVEVTVAELRSAETIEQIRKKQEEEERAATAKREAEKQAYLDWERNRREAEGKAINGWVRPPVKPVKMTKPLDPPPVTGNSYYVAKNGNDTSGDGSKEKPWQTIQHGLNQLHPGDCLYVRGGEYTEGMLTFGRSGRADAYITVAGYPGEKAVILGTGLAVFNFSAGSSWTPKRLFERAYLVVRDLTIDARNCNNAFRNHGPMMLEEYRENPLKSRRFRHNIWIVNNDISGGNGSESLLGAGYGAHHIVISNNRIHDCKGLNSYRYSDGTIVEWNKVYNCGRDNDDAGAIKSMAPGVIIRYNTLIDNYRSSTSKKPGWAPRSRGGKQWRFLQGVTGIYLDWAMLDDRKPYPKAMITEDTSNYVYGNTVSGSNAGIYVYQSSHARVFDNVVFDSGRKSHGGWVEGKKNGKWLEFVGPAGYGLAVTKSKDVKVYNNIVFNSLRSGLATQEAPGYEGYNNVVYGNDLAQIHVRKGEEGIFGFNTILQATDQGPPFRRLKQGFATIAAYAEEYPYSQVGTRLLTPPGQVKPLDFAKKVLTQFQEDQWNAARKDLLARAREAGVNAPITTVPQAPYDPTGGLQEPIPWEIPGVVEFENYDVGGPNVSYQDVSQTNQGGHYRRDYVDVKKSPKGSNGAVVGYTENEEWLEYTIEPSQTRSHTFTIAYATPKDDRKIRFELDGNVIGKTITFPATASWDDLATLKVDSIPLKQGQGVLRVIIENGPIDLDRVTIK